MLGITQAQRKIIEENGHQDAVKRSDIQANKRRLKRIQKKQKEGENNG